MVPELADLASETPSDPRLAGTRALALALRARGQSIGQVREALGLHRLADARALLMEALAERRAAEETVEEIRELELERLDQLTAALWPQVEQGELKAIEEARKIGETRRKLLGLDKTAGDGNSGGPWEGFVVLPLEAKGEQ